MVNKRKALESYGYFYDGCMHFFGGFKILGPIHIIKLGRARIFFNRPITQIFSV